MRKPLPTAFILRAAFLHCRVNIDLREEERWAIARPRSSRGRTVHVADIAAGRANSNPEELVTISNSGNVYLIFRATDNEDGTELWAIKGP